MDLAASADQIQSLAQDNLWGIRDLLDRDPKEDLSALSMHLSHLAASTADQADRAAAACRDCRQPLGRAKLRALIVQANLAGMAAAPAQRPALDRLVAYFMRSQPNQVGVLRREGLGYGAAAYLLAVANASHQEPDQLLPSSPRLESLVTELKPHDQGGFGSRIMMKFLVHALSEEVSALHELDVA